MNSIRGGGVGGIFKDPDGIEIQFLPRPDTLVTAAVPSALVPSEQGLVTPLRVDSALLKVSNMDRALEFYRILYGKETRRTKDSAVYEFRNGSRLLLENTSYAYGSSQARIARYGIRVREFDRAAVKQLIPTTGRHVRVRRWQGAAAARCGRHRARTRRLILYCCKEPRFGAPPSREAVRLTATADIFTLRSGRPAPLRVASRPDCARSCQ